MITITGTVGPSGKYLVTGMPVNTKTPAVMKISFENNTGGTNLELRAGADADFATGTGGMLLSDSGGPGFRFLTIIDVSLIAGKIIWVHRAVGSAAAAFTLNIE